MANVSKFPCHYSFTNLPSVFDEEALTALELCGRLAAKINEIIKAYNNLDDETREQLAAQDKEIAEGLATLTEKLPPYVSDWLGEHPEITTTIQDGEILFEKFHETLKHRTENGYVIPEMFGTVGEGDDSAAIQAAVDNAEGLPVLLAHDYTIKSSIWVGNYKHLIVEKTLYVDGDIPGIRMCGRGSKVTGKGCIQASEAFTGKGHGIYFSASAPTTYNYYNVVSVGEIRNFSNGVFFECVATNGPTYFNKIDGVTFVDCLRGINLYGYANGNKIGNLTFYNCGLEKDPDNGAITFGGDDTNGHPIENMFYNISTTNAENRSSIGIWGKCEHNHFSGMQFENGGENAWGFYVGNPENFSNNTICGLIDINNQGSKRGKDNTWIMAFDGKNEMPAIKSREQYRPCGFKYALKKDSSQPAWTDGSIYTVARVTLPAYAVANINLRGMLVSSAAGDIATGNTGNIVVRAKADGSIVPVEDGAFSIQSDGWINYRTPDAGVGVAHYTTCFVEMDVITTTRDSSQSMTPGHYGVTILPYDTFKEYKGDW